MPVTVEASGTQTAVVGTEHSLHVNATAKVFTLTVDTRNMVDGDEVELRIYKRMLSADADRILAYAILYRNKQGDAANPAGKGDVVKESVPVPSPFSIEFTLKQTAGAAGRNFKWVVNSV